MSFNGLISKPLREPALTIGLTLVFSYLFNFVWESVHSDWLYGDHDFGAARYVRMVGYASGIDALLVLGIFCFISLVWRDLFWIERMNPRHALAVVLSGMLVSGMIEYRAVYVLKEWRYGPSMPLLLGIGLSPLVQIGVTGLLAFWLIGRLLYRCGHYAAEGTQHVRHTPADPEESPRTGESPKGESDRMEEGCPGHALHPPAASEAPAGRLRTFLNSR